MLFTKSLQYTCSQTLNPKKTKLEELENMKKYMISISGSQRHVKMFHVVQMANAVNVKMKLSYAKADMRLKAFA